MLLWCWGCHWCCFVGFSCVGVTGIVEVFFVGLDGVGLVGVGVSLVGFGACWCWSCWMLVLLVFNVYVIDVAEIAEIVRKFRF